ncbi:nuclear transport factor 2 family protein [Novosphingobium resinovorum]|uniref:nuclear transport factor 2 family protein n=1 Tax=Novosphingobium resinovorum TaxID=158500 RepID=UPI002ED45255|nr:nuclear transport factor 2 family protein [Novosphingobium resinovorum]
MLQITDAELLARAEISDLLVRYGQAQDQDEWSLYEGVFTPDATIHFPGMPMESLGAAEFGQFLQDFNRTRISGQHLIGNTLYRFAADGESAHVVSEVTYITLHPTDTPGRVRRIRGNGLYSDRAVRTAQGWRIARRDIAQKNVEIDEGDYDPVLLAAIESAATTRWFARPGNPG